MHAIQVGRTRRPIAAPDRMWGRVIIRLYSLGLSALAALVGTQCFSQGPPALFQRAKKIGLEARQIWVDASANWYWLVYPEKIKEFCANAKKAGFNEVIIDAKPIVGYTLYPSAIATQMTTWKGIQMPAGMDVLGTMVREAHAVGLRCLANFAIFSEGHSSFDRAGDIWNHPEWASIVAVPYWTDGVARLELESVLKQPKRNIPLFVNPLNEAVRKREMAIMIEVAKNYPVDGLVMDDRLRFEGIGGDFSAEMHQAFTGRFGEPGFWPGSILLPPLKHGEPPRRGPRWPEYQLLRTSIIRDFVGDLRQELYAAGSSVPVGCYVGAWYDKYESVGVNWASDLLPVQYPNAEPEMRFTGEADFLDFLCVGAYYSSAEPYEQPDNKLQTVAGACQRAVEVAGASAFIYGTIYLNDYKTPDQLRKAIRAARENTLGISVFDASYIIKDNLWGVFEEEFKGLNNPPPHAAPSLLRELRQD